MAAAGCCSLIPATGICLRMFPQETIASTGSCLQRIVHLMAQPQYAPPRLTSTPIFCIKRFLKLAQVRSSPFIVSHCRIPRATCRLPVRAHGPPSSAHPPPPPRQVCSDTSRRTSHVTRHSHVTLFFLLLFLLASNFLPNRAAALRFLSTASLVHQSVIQP